MDNESTQNRGQGEDKPADSGKQVPHEGHDTQHAPAQKPIKTSFAVTGLVIVLLVFAALAVFGILSRIHHTHVLAKSTEELAAPTVIALAPKSGASVDTFLLPGNVTAYTDSPIYARTSGYLTKWYYDIGAHVKKGALLAEIATPELDQQLLQAQADLGTADANAKNAHAQAGEGRDVLVRDRAPDHQRDVVHARRLLRLADLPGQRDVHAGQDRDADHVGVLGLGRGHDLPWSLAQSEVDDLGAGVTQRHRDHLHPPVVAIQSRFRQHHPHTLSPGPARARRSWRRPGWPR